LAGKIPAVLYGEQTDPMPLLVDGTQLIKLYHASDNKKNAIINLVFPVKGKPQKQEVISYQFGYDPISNRINHVDFLKIGPNTKLVLKVPVILQGTAPGVKMGGTLVKEADMLKIECPSDSIPQNIAVDISKLELGQNIRVRDLPLSNKVKILSSQEKILAQVMVGKGAKAAEAAEPAKK
jgi:large subunit ribosomal protein L25